MASKDAGVAGTNIDVEVVNHFDVENTLNALLGDAPPASQTSVPQHSTGDEQISIGEDSKSTSLSSTSDLFENLIECVKCKSWSHISCEAAWNQAIKSADQSGELSGITNHICGACHREAYLMTLEMLEVADRYDYFLMPVTDAIAPGYSEKIKNPMDLRTMRRKALNFAYATPQDFRNDFELMLYNAMLFNPRGSRVWKAAWKMFELHENRSQKTWTALEP